MASKFCHRNLKKYVRRLVVICVSLFVCAIFAACFVMALPTLSDKEIEIHGKDEMCIIIIKVCFDISIIVCFIVCLSKTHIKGKQFLLVSFTILKSVEILFFVIGSILLMRYSDICWLLDELEDIRITAAFAMMSSLGYWFSILLLYTFLKCYKFKVKSEGHENAYDKGMENDNSKTKNRLNSINFV